MWCGAGTKAELWSAERSPTGPHRPAPARPALPAAALKQRLEVVRWECGGAGLGCDGRHFMLSAEWCVDCRARNTQHLHLHSHTRDQAQHRAAGGGQRGHQPPPLRSGPQAASGGTKRSQACRLWIDCVRCVEGGDPPHPYHPLPPPHAQLRFLQSLKSRGGSR